MEIREILENSDYVINCSIEEQAITLCNFLHSIGRRWVDRSSYLNNTKWSDEKNRTCYCVAENKYGSYETYVDLLNKNVVQFGDIDFSMNITLEELIKTNLYAVHCKKKEYAITLYQHLQELNKICNNDYNYADNMKWDLYEENTCYIVDSGMYEHVDIVRCERIVIKYEDIVFNSKTGLCNEKNN